MPGRSAPGFDSRARTLCTRLGCGLRRFRLVGGDPNCLNLQPLVRVESLLTIQALHKFSRGLANRSSDAAGIDFYRPALGASLAVFIFLLVQVKNVLNTLGILVPGSIAQDASGPR